MSTIGERALPSLTTCLATPELGKCVLEAIGALALLVFDTPANVQAPGFVERKKTALTLTSRWMSYRRNPAQINRILSATCSCPELLAAHEIHYFGMRISDGGDPPGQLFLHVCTKHLRDMESSHKAFRNVKLFRMPARSSWPYSTAQLLPHGPENTVRGYLDWLSGDDVISAGRMMMTLSVVIEHSWPTVIPVMITKRLFVDRFIEAIPRWSDLWSKYTQRDFSGLYNTNSECISSLFRYLLAILRFLCLEYADPATTAYLLRDKGEGVLVTCDRLMSTTADIAQRVQLANVVKGHQHVIELARTTGILIFNVFPELLPRLGQLKYITTLAENTSHLNSPLMLSLNILADRLRYQHIRQDCAAPGCHHTNEKNGRAFHYCSGCRWIPYCSRSCQQEAWRRKDGLQHRDVCGLIRTLRTRYNIPHSEKLKDAMRYIPSPMSQKEIRNVEEINAHLHALVTYDIEH
jgi:hypothetical protein